jgi:hypothetical protein
MSWEPLQLRVWETFQLRVADSVAIFAFYGISQDLLPGATSVTINGATWNEVTFDQILKFYLLASILLAAYIGNYRKCVPWLFRIFTRHYEQVFHHGFIPHSLGELIWLCLMEFFIISVHFAISMVILIIFKYHVTIVFVTCTISDHWAYQLVILSVYTYANITRIITCIKTLKDTQIIPLDPNVGYHDAPKGIYGECSICYDSTDDQPISKMNNCTHTYHTTCISEWFVLSRQCPMCREVS